MCKNHLFYFNENFRPDDGDFNPNFGPQDDTNPLKLIDIQMENVPSFKTRPRSSS